MDPEIREALLALVRGCSDLREATARVTELALNALMLLAQMIQKTQMFAGMNRKLVLICQTPLLDYMQENFDFSEVHQQRATDVFNIHAYDYLSSDTKMDLVLARQLGADLMGVERIMGAEVNSNHELEVINTRILERATPEYRFNIFE